MFVFAPDTDYEVKFPPNFKIYIFNEEETSFRVLFRHLYKRLQNEK